MAKFPLYVYFLSLCVLDGKKAWGKTEKMLGRMMAMNDVIAGKPYLFIFGFISDLLFSGLQLICFIGRSLRLVPIQNIFVRYTNGQ